MANAKDIQGLAGNASGFNGAGFVLSKRPRLPDEVKRRFPSMIAYEEQMDEFDKRLIFNVRQALGTGIAN